MKRLVAAWIVGIIVTAICPPDAIAQAQKDAPVAAAPPSAPAATRTAARAKSRSWTRADARVCLEFPTNLQVIKCAEKYRYTRVPA